jgi:hypothetical protein
LEDHISGSSWPIWARLCLLERPDSLLFIKNMKFGIYRLLPILGHHECLVVYNSHGTSCPVMCIYGLYRPTNVLYKTTLTQFDTFEIFAKKISFNF